MGADAPGQSAAANGRQDEDERGSTGSDGEPLLGRGPAAWGRQTSGAGGSGAAAGGGCGALAGEVECVRQRKELQRLSNADGGAGPRRPVHSLDLDEISAAFGTVLTEGGRCQQGRAGLEQGRARSLLERHGPNRLTPPKLEDKYRKLLRMMFSGVLNGLLWCCVLLEVLLLLGFPGEKDPVTPLILSAVIVGTTVLQWITELRAESSMQELQALQASQPVRVLRHTLAGERLALDTDPASLVVGDAVCLAVGQRVPADVRIVHCSDGMEVDNSALTGESLPAVRTSAPEKESMPATEARCLAFFGTTVLRGSAICVVYATGDNTFLGEIALSMQGPRKPSTLECQVKHLAHVAARFALCVAGFVLGANLLSPRQRTFIEILENCATALFTQVPEGLLPTVTFSLMVASAEMRKRQVLVKRLDAIETLGCVSVLCSDKTGTMTTGVMAVQDLAVPRPGGTMEAVCVQKGSERSSHDEQLRRLGVVGVLNSTAELKAGVGEVVGSPTEAAILNASIDCVGGSNELAKLRSDNTVLFEIPFNSENKWMLTVHSANTLSEGTAEYLSLIKGAPEHVLSLCAMDDAQRAAANRMLQDLMRLGRRVLCAAQRPIERSEAPPDGRFEGSCMTDCNFPLEGFEFVGLFGIEDPPKRGVAEAIRRAQDAGMTVVMVTGDHPATACAIAARLGILEKERVQDGDLEAQAFDVITGPQLVGMLPKKGDFSGDESPEVDGFWRRAVVEARVFARVSPLHKRVIVQAFQRFGKGGIGDIVGMTGDGVNDAPALRQADVGVALGVRGTEVAKDAADIVLLDDDLASIIAGTEQGRLSSENLQKSIMYTLCSKVAQVAPAFGELMGIPEALSAVQVLLIDIGTDIWTAVAYAAQPAESSLMNRPPRHPGLEQLATWRVLFYSYGYIGVLQTAFCWLMFFCVTPSISSFLARHKELEDRDYTLEDKFTHHQSMTVYYWTLVLGQIAAALAATTKAQPIFLGGGYGLPNRMLNMTIAAEVLISLAVIYLPPFQAIFEMAPLPLHALLLPAISLIGILGLEDLRKKERWFLTRV